MHDETLPLPVADPVPFTRAQALARGTTRGQLARLVDEGAVRRLLRGVYVAAGVPDTVALRASALALAAPREGVVVDRTAAWLHGVPLRDDPVPVEIVAHGPARRLVDRDVVDLHGWHVTTPLRTALDLGRLRPAEEALAAMDALVRVDGFPQTALLAELPRFAGQRGATQLRRLAAQVDPRADGAAESVLRLRWHEARVPTASPGLVVVAGPRVVRLALGATDHRFGAVLAGRLAAADLVALEGQGWRVLVLAPTRVLSCDPVVLVRHLEREFHQHLLAEAGGW